MTEKQNQLLDLYAQMARDGYQRSDGKQVKRAYNDMEIRHFAPFVRDLFKTHHIDTVLDYGCGGSDYDAAEFRDSLNAKDYFNLKEVHRFEPARNLDERKEADAVVCFDVLEHIFIADVPATVRELFSFARRLLVVNVACYQAAALLPNGENAHITVRDPHWWKGLFDAICVEFPHVSVALLCSPAYMKAQAFPVWSAAKWLESGSFSTSAI